MEHGAWGMELGAGSWKPASISGPPLARERSPHHAEACGTILSDGHTGTHQRQRSRGAKRTERNHDAEPGAGWHAPEARGLRGEDAWAAWAIPACFRDARLDSPTSRSAEPASAPGTVGCHCWSRCSSYRRPKAIFTG